MQELWQCGNRYRTGLSGGKGSECLSNLLHQLIWQCGVNFLLSPQHSRQHLFFLTNKQIEQVYIPLYYTVKPYYNQLVTIKQINRQNKQPDLNLLLTLTHTYNQLIPDQQVIIDTGIGNSSNLHSNIQLLKKQSINSNKNQFSNKMEKQQFQSQRSTKITLLGFLILALQIGMLFAYGFAGKFSYIQDFSQVYETRTLPIYFYMSLFAVGVGLMLSYYGRGAALGLATTIFAICLNIQLSPLIQKFWIDTFIGGFNLTTPSGNTDVSVQYQQLTGVYISVIIQRSTMALTISYLISCLATIGRVGLFDSFISLIIYNIFWPIPLYCNLKVYYRDLPSPQNAFDDFGLTFIYTFAAFFGIVYSIFLNRKYDRSITNTLPSKVSTVMAIFGTTIVFCTIPSTVLISPLSSNTLANRYNVGVLNVFYSQITGIISCITFSLLFSGFKRLNIVSVIVSVFCGPAIVGQFAALQTNISACLTVGAFGGFVAAFWTQIIHPKLINKTKIYDTLSLTGGVLIPSFFGGVVVTPILYAIYYDNSHTTLSGKFNTRQYIRYQYIFYFVTVGAAIVGAIVAGILSLCSRKADNDFTIRKMFSPDYGLCNSHYSHQQNQEVKSQQSGEQFRRKE